MQSHTLHESGNLGEIKEMFADEIFALQKIQTAAVHTVSNCFCWSRPNVTYFMPNAFKNTKSFWFTENTCKPRAPSRSRKPLRLAYDSLRLASQLAVVSTAAA